MRITKVDLEMAEIRSRQAEREAIIRIIDRAIRAAESAQRLPHVLDELRHIRNTIDNRKYSLRHD